jgi:hypothetical protein
MQHAGSGHRAVIVEQKLKVLATPDETGLGDTMFIRGALKLSRNRRGTVFGMP